MATVKEDVLRLVQALPDDVSLEDVMEELYFKAQVDEGLRQLDEGHGIPHEEMKRRMAKWLED